MARKTEAEFYVARRTGIIKLKGKVYEYVLGRTYPRNHPLIAALPEKFAPLIPDGDVAPKVIA